MDPPRSSDRSSVIRDSSDVNMCKKYPSVCLSESRYGLGIGRPIHSASFRSKPSCGYGDRRDLGLGRKVSPSRASNSGPLICRPWDKTARTRGVGRGRALTDGYKDSVTLGSVAHTIYTEGAQFLYRKNIDTHEELPGPEGQVKIHRQGSNPGPLASKPSALPVEPRCR